MMAQQTISIVGQHIDPVTTIITHDQRMKLEYCCRVKVLGQRIRMEAILTTERLSHEESGASTICVTGRLFEGGQIQNISLADEEAYALTGKNLLQRRKRHNNWGRYILDSMGRPIYYRDSGGMPRFPKASNLRVSRGNVEIFGSTKKWEKMNTLLMKNGWGVSSLVD